MRGTPIVVGVFTSPVRYHVLQCFVLAGCTGTLACQFHAGHPRALATIMKLSADNCAYLAAPTSIGCQLLTVDSDFLYMSHDNKDSAVGVLSEVDLVLGVKKHTVYIQQCEHVSPLPWLFSSFYMHFLVALLSTKSCRFKPFGCNELRHEACLCGQGALRYVTDICPVNVPIIQLTGTAVAYRA
jgi:hypothetical protein